MNVGDFEEGRLHNRVGTVAKTEFRGYLRRIDDVEIDMVLGQVRLHVVGQRLLYRIDVLQAVEQERTALLEPLEHVVFVHVRRHMAGHEIGRGHQIGRSDGAVAETQVRASETA